MKVKWLGHASFAITADDGTCIVTDPYEPGGFGGAIGYGPITEKADVVTVSHDHADHNYVAGVPGAPTVLKGAGAHEARGIGFKGFETAHDSSGGAERGSNVIFTFTMDGIAVCHLGDLGHRLTADQIDDIGKVDLLLIPVGGVFTIDAERAAKVVSSLAPKIVIPMHFKTAKCGFDIDPVDKFLEGQDNVEKVGSSEVDVDVTDVDNPPKIVVLEPAC